MIANCNTLSSPLFTIGVTTYNRRALLGQALQSIQQQSFTEFEVIVGNDYPQESLSACLYGFDDSRFHFINHPRSLGERENMNLLLHMSRGRYFTWLADDDLYAPDFLMAAHSALLQFNFPKCVYTSYEIFHGETTPNPTGIRLASQSYSGREFVRRYLAGNLKAIGCMGMFETNCLRQLGGVQKLTDGPYALYSEYLLLLQAGQFDVVGYIDSPLILFRSHQGSFGPNCIDSTMYQHAGENLARKGLLLLQQNPLRQDFYANASSFLRMPFTVFADKLSQRNSVVRLADIFAYSTSMVKQLAVVRGTLAYWRVRCTLAKLTVALVFRHVKRKARIAAPPLLVTVVRAVRNLFRRQSRRPFWG